MPFFAGRWNSTVAWSASTLFLAAAALSQSARSTSLAHFHHLHLNSTDPSAAIEFYASTLESQKRKFGGAVDAVWTNHVWLLFNKVPEPPKAEISSGIWHMGWGGGENMRDTYQKQITSGTKFQTPITDIGDQCDGKGGTGRFFFAYIDGPDHALIELNTTAEGNRRFGHLHLLSADPIAAGEWYVKEFGLTRRGQGSPSREERYRCGRQTAPSVSLMMDDVNVIIYPIGNAKAAFPEVWKGRREIESSGGHTIDHVGFSVESLDQTLERLKSDGVKVTEEPLSILAGKVRVAFIEGPDRVRIEILEDRTP